jgi:hypoxanthine-DNA glycosylase
VRRDVESGYGQPVESFPPLFNGSAHVLILGSMPGMASLSAGQYYAHPRNAFWRIMRGIFGIDESLPYSHRTTALLNQGLAVWDVLKACVRQGSLDSDIVSHSIVANDFKTLFAQCPAIGKIVFNGSTAQQTYIRHVLPTLDARCATIPMVRLPSTSPANSGLDFAEKMHVWREALVDVKPD